METEIYYFAAWTDSGLFYGCDHKHKTVAEAVYCDAAIQHAGSYVLAVEKGILRALHRIEEVEFCMAPRLIPSRTGKRDLPN